MKLEMAARKFDIAMEWGLYAAMFFLPISMFVVSAALLFCLAVWCGKLFFVKRRETLRRTPLDYPIWAFTLAGALSILGSPDRFASAYNFSYLMGHYLLVYYLIIHNLQSCSQIKRLLLALFFSAACISLYGFWQYMHGVDISQYRWVDGEQFPGLRMRVFSTMENPNIFAGYLVTVIALASGIMLAGEGGKTKYWYAGLLCMWSACLALTYSRGGWISFLGIMIILGLIRNRHVLWLVIAVPLLALWADPMLLERMVSIANPVDSSSALRIALWESSLAMLRDHPVLGVGWGAYWMCYPGYDFFINDSLVTIYHAHNIFLHIGAELGLVGLGIFLWLLLSIIYLTGTAYRRSGRGYPDGLFLGIMVAFMALIINGLTDYIMFNVQMSLLFWILTGIAVKARMLVMSEEQLKKTHFSA